MICLAGYVLYPARAFAVCLLFFTLCGCRGNESKLTSSTSTANATAHSADTPGPIRLEPVTEKAGIEFSLGYNGKSPLTILETSPGGCAFLDYDTDGWPDALLVGPDKVALFRNRGNGTFENVTARSGLRQKGFWMGCAVGDYDADGSLDIFLTGYKCHALYRNTLGKREKGKGKSKEQSTRNSSLLTPDAHRPPPTPPSPLIPHPFFEDVSAQSGVSGLEWSLSAAFADLNGDDKLDLFVSQYLHFGSDTQQICEVGKTRSACGPEVYSALSGKLFLNIDGKRFRAAPWEDTGKTWGVLASDLMQTGKPSLYLANDMMPGDLWTRQAGKWENVGPASNTAYDAQGHNQGGMGVDSGDYDNDGRLDLIVTTYFAQAISLYHNDGGGFFTVTSNTTGIGPPTMPYVGFGVGFMDLDNDGWLDLILTNGHVRDNVHNFDSSQTYAQPLQTFRNENGRVFRDVSATLGKAAELRMVGRGMAFADYNKDGKMDVLICNLNGLAILLENQSPSGHWLDVRLKASGANRDGLGALVTLDSGGRKQLREIRTSGSVLAASDPAAHFGLGEYSGPVTLTIRWPDGKITTENISAVDKAVAVKRTGG